MESLHLTIVRLVLHDKFTVHGSGGIGTVISDFLVQDVPLHQACEFKSTVLLELLWRRGLRDIESDRWSVAKLVHSEPHYRRWEFAQSMVSAVRRQDLKVVPWLLNHFGGCPIYEEVLNEAVKVGNVWLLKSMEGDSRHGGLRWGDVDLDAAGKDGHWEMVHYVHEVMTDGKVMSNRLVELAFEQNDLHQIKWLVTNGYPVSIGAFPKLSAATWPICKMNVRYLVLEQRAKLSHGEMSNLVRGALTQAGEAGDLEFIQWLAAQHLLLPEYVFPYALRCASMHGHLPVVRWLLSERDQLGLGQGPSDAMFTAVQGGQLELVQWLYQRYGCDPEVQLFQKSHRTTDMDVAAEYGHLEVLKYLHGIKEQRGPQCTSRAMDAAAASGNLDVVKWLHEHRSEGCTTAAMDNAAANGHVDIVEWLHFNRSEGCTAAALERAASRSFHSPTCPRARSCCCALKKPEEFEDELIELMQYLTPNHSVTTAMDLAAAVGNLKVVQWLHDHTATNCGTFGMDVAAASGRLDIVNWLHENRFEGCSFRAMTTAAKNGHLEVVKWLQMNRSEGCPAAAMDAAASFIPFSSPRRQQFQIVQWLLSSSKEISISSSFVKAFHSRHFETLLLLHAHEPKFTANELTGMRNRLDFDGAKSYGSGYEIRQWLEENYPSCEDMA